MGCRGCNGVPGIQGARGEPHVIAIRVLLYIRCCMVPKLRSGLGTVWYCRHRVPILIPMLILS